MNRSVCRTTATTLVLALTASSSAQAGQAAAADELVARFLAAQQVPAISAAVVHDGRVVWSSALGFADVENRVQATPETLFRIASVTKPLTAVGVMTLVQSGRLELDAPIHTYCDAFPAKQWPVTARQLLSHTGGLRDYTEVRGGVWNVRTVGGTQIGSSTVYVPTLSQAVEVFDADELMSEPGTEYRYSNLGYVLLGCAIEGASGMDYAAYMDEAVFQPAGMTRTQPNDAWSIIENRARSYQMRSEQNADWWWFIPAQQQVMEIGTLYNARFEDTSHKLPAGGMLSTATDLVRLAAALFGDDLLGELLRREMYTEQLLASGEGTGWGLGWGVARDGDHQIVGLRGSQPGAAAALRMIPSERFAVAVIANRDFVPVQELIDELFHAWGYATDR